MKFYNHDTSNSPSAAIQKTAGSPSILVRFSPNSTNAYVFQNHFGPKSALLTLHMLIWLAFCKVIGNFTSNALAKKKPWPHTQTLVYGFDARSISRETKSYNLVRVVVYDELWSRIDAKPSPRYAHICR